MKISEAFKVFQLNLLRQAGVAVTPEQVGLKTDPIADLQARSNGSTFSNLLGRMATQGAGNLAEPPSPPTPPADPADTAAQVKYHEDLLIYNRNFQLYNQQFMQLLLGRLAQIQQSVAASNQQQQQKSNPVDAGVLGIGGILGGISDT